MKPLAEQTLYEILEVPPDAGSPEIAAAVDRALSTFGPGSLAMYSLISPEDQSTLSRRIEEARATLLDPAARARYDASLGERAPAEPARAPYPLELPPVIPALSPERVLLAAERDREARGDDQAPVPVDLEAEGADAAEAVEGPEATAAAEAVEGPEAAAAAGAEAGSEGAAAIEAPGDAPGEAEPTPPSPERPAHTPAPSGHVWPPPAPAPVAAEVPPPAAPAPLLLSSPVAPRPIRLEREVSPPPARPVPTAPPAAIRTPPPREASIPEFAAWSGDALRSVREARGLSLQQIAERTKVTRHHIENIESDRYTALPAPVYLRGILLSLARELRLDGQKMSRSYLERMASALAPPPQGPVRR